MYAINKPWICTHCGCFALERFVDDICPDCHLTDWQCRRCGYTLTAGDAPLLCCQCGALTSFTNITAYIPDWPVV